MGNSKGIVKRLYLKIIRSEVIELKCGYGGIGRRVRFRILC